MDSHLRGGSFGCDCRIGERYSCCSVQSGSDEVNTKTVTITYDADKTNVKNLQAGFKKFNYEAEFVKETKKDDKKADKK